uniref:Uncharacterized protein n=1 Tax=Anopheles atroparvus TaxID=41427 RepID=A0A182IV57_ANOAO
MLNLSAASGEVEVPNIWRNPLSSSADSMSRHRDESLDGRVSANENKIPDLIQKELDKRRIGDSINTIANNLKRNNSWDNANRAIGSGQGVKLASRKSSADSRHSDPSQARTSQTRIIDLTQTRYASGSSSGVPQPPWRTTPKRASSAQKPSPMFPRKQNNLLAKSRSTDESIVSLNRNIFGSLISLDVEDDIAPF